MRIDKERIEELYGSFRKSFDTKYMNEEIPKIVWDFLSGSPLDAIDESESLMNALMVKIDKKRVVADIKEHTRKTHAKNLDISGVKDIEERLLTFHGAIERMADNAIRSMILASIAVFIEEVGTLKDGDR